MRALPNVERSGFHPGQYVGYARGAVYRVRKGEALGWGASLRVQAPGWPVPSYLSARTLAALSDRLARL